MNRPRLHSFLGLALIFSLVSFAPAPTWAACKNSGGGGSSFNYGSEVTGNAVTICGNTSAVVPARTSTIAKPAPKPVSKPVAKAPAKPAPKPTLKAVPKIVKPLTMADIRALIRISDVPSPKPLAVAKPVPKPAPKPAPKAVAIVKVPANTVSVLSNSPASASAANGSANFSPDEASAGVSPSSELTVGELATFYSDPKVHFRLGSVLGRAAEVRFSPLQTAWQFGDGFLGSGALATHVFSSGTFNVQVTITYGVSYRFAGQTAWISDPGQIQMPAEVQVSVGDSSNWVPPEAQPLPASKLPYLVSANCLANASSIGCFD